MSRLNALRTAVTTAPVRAAARLQTHVRPPIADGEAGMTTAEYAVGTVAACGFGGVLYKVVTSPQVLELVKQVILRAFRLSF